MFGSEFKKLRLKNHISLRTAAKNVTSPTSFSRWENDEGDMDYGKVIELLHNIHISPSEFVFITAVTPHDPFIRQIEIAWKNDSSFELKELTIQNLDNYNSTHKDTYLFNAAMAANYYYDLTDKNILPTKYKELLEEKLSSVTFWSKRNIYIFGNSLSLLSTSTIYGLACLIIDDIENIKKTGFENYLDMLLGLLNAFQELVLFDTKRADLFLLKFDTIPLNRYSLYIKIKKNFLKALLLYKKTNNSSYPEDYIRTMRQYDLNDIADTFESAFKTLQTIKSKA